MGRYLTDARYHLERIEYYHRFAADLGYKQAKHHYDELCSLIGRSMQSKNDKHDAPVIVALKESAAELMDVMRKRAEAESD
jgi:hypothetical protein